MKNFRKKLNLSLLAFLILLFADISNAQISSKPKIATPTSEYNNCGGYQIDTIAMRRIIDFRNQNHNRSQTLTPYLIRVYFHICALDNGSLPAATLSQITDEFNILKADYASFNICFLFAGVDYIFNTTLDTNFNVNSGDFNLYNPYKVPNCINVFYQWKIKGNNSSCPPPNYCGIAGYAFFIPSNACLVSSGSIGSQTISHELGHCMGLFHTFEKGFGYEAIDGSNSWIAGDQIQDTPADPLAWYSVGNSCFSETGNFFTYTGNCLDPNFQSNYTPPYTNIMSYWHHLNQVLTQDQYVLMDAVLSDILYIDIQACESPNNVTDGPGINVTSGYHMVSAVNTLTTSGNVFLGGSSKSTLAAGSTVLLEPGFHADATNNAFVWIKPSECSYSPRHAMPGFETNNNSDPNVLTVYPNPSSDKFNFEYQLLIDDRVTISIYNSELKLVKQIAGDWQLSGKNKLELDIADFTTGIYFAKLQTSTMLRTAKLVVLKGN